LDDLAARVGTARRALDRFASFSGKAYISDDTRDLAIFWFILAFEAVWKAAKAMIEAEGPSRLLQYGSPKNIIREAEIAGLLAEDEAKVLLERLEDRNRAVHVYREAMALEILPRLATYKSLLEVWIDRMEARLSAR
jgi:nucleotidyltransferase substrate binding protein (TIGR01987 family)